MPPANKGKVNSRKKKEEKDGNASNPTSNVGTGAAVGGGGGGVVNLDRQATAVVSAWQVPPSNTTRGRMVTRGGAAAGVKNGNLISSTLTSSQAMVPSATVGDGATGARVVGAKLPHKPVGAPTPLGLSTPVKRSRPSKVTTSKPPPHKRQRKVDPVPSGTTASTSATVTASSSGASSGTTTVTAPTRNAPGSVAQHISKSNFQAPKLSNTSSNSNPASYPIASHAKASSSTFVPSSITVTTPQPPYWSLHYSETCSSSSIYRTFGIESSTKEYGTLTKLMSPLRIISAKNIVNPDLWNKFTAQRISMIKSKSDDLPLLGELGVDRDQIERIYNLSIGFTKNPLLQLKSSEYFPNEVLLFHCTRSTEKLDKILIEGLDERLGNGGRLGKGIYFADDPAKSIMYDGSSDGTVIVCGVLLGDCLSVDGMPNMDAFVREPVKDPKQKRILNDQFFDSITGKPAQNGGYNEYVIFNKAQCCPLYLVKYQRGYKEYSENYPDVYESARKESPTVAWRNIPNEKSPMPNPDRKVTWPFFADTLFEKMGTSRQISNSINNNKTGAAGSLAVSNIGTVTRLPNVMKMKTETEECSSCRKIKYGVWTVSWQELKVKCNHPLCNSCYRLVEITRTTMSGIKHTLIKCPVCQNITGTEVGDCPDGMMTVKYVPEWCQGSALTSIQINYVVDSDGQKLNRTAYLPKTEEGKEVLQLLRVAWDRRLCFKIGTSLTTGQTNVLVWNIHHKTSLTGGPMSFGYPDAAFFPRVKAELKAYGIE